MAILAYAKFAEKSHAVNIVKKTKLNCVRKRKKSDINEERPDSWFNYDSTDSSEFKACWALENLQPLPAFDNLKKNNRWEG